jgi:broad specificity phosphatase PhoE
MKRTHMLLPLLWVITAALVLPSIPSRAFDLYVLRHAETMGNVTGDYSEENQRAFSPQGLEQIARITDKLAPYRFDRVFVSPTYRTRQTILPYLKTHGCKAEIWPELEECCCDSRGLVSAAAVVPLGDPIELDETEKAYFVVRADGAYRWRPETESEGLAQIVALKERLLKEFSRTTQSVLIVTHSCNGSRIMELMLGVRPAGRFSPANAAMSLLREEEPGRFRLLRYNDQPFEQRYYWVSADGREAVPNEPFRIKLVPRFFAQQTRSGYQARWHLRNAQGNIVARGEEFFSPRGGITEDSVLELEIPTSGAQYGETWRLDTQLSADGEVLHKWTFDILFPIYQSLAGPWHIKAGDAPEWAAVYFDDSPWATSRVPQGWEADALPNYDGTAWYRKSFTVPAEKRKLWEGQTLAVCFGAVDDADETFLNGECIGKSGLFPPEKITAWDRPRLYEFPAELLAATNVIAVRVSDWGGGGGLWKGPVAIGPRNELQRALDQAEKNTTP